MKPKLETSPFLSRLFSIVVDSILKRKGVIKISESTASHIRCN